jgi:hypothetical protein
VRASTVGAPRIQPSRPRPEHRRVWASVERDAKQTIAQSFVEAIRRAPKRELRWAVVVRELRWAVVVREQRWAVVVDDSDLQLRIIRRRTP